MLALTDVEKEVLALSEDDYLSFRKWFYEQDHKKWDQEIEADSDSGKLDFLINEALSEKAHGQLKPL